MSVSAYSLPYLEILLGIYRLAGLFRKLSAWITNALVILFIVALAQGIACGLEIDCGCFGGAGNEADNLWPDALRDVGLLALGLHIALSPIGHFSVDLILRRNSRNEPYEA